MWRGNHGTGKQSVHKRTGNAVLRVLIKPDKWAHRNPAKFNQSKCIILHLRHNQLTQQAGWSQLDEKQLLALQERTWECYCTANWTAFSNMPLTKKAKCIQSCTNKCIARSSREGILHLWSTLKATSKFNVEFSPVQNRLTHLWEATEMDRDVEHKMSEKLNQVRPFRENGVGREGGSGHGVWRHHYCLLLPNKL